MATGTGNLTSLAKLFNDEDFPLPPSDTPRLDAADEQSDDTT